MAHIDHQQNLDVTELVGCFYLINSRAHFRNMISSLPVVLCGPVRNQQLWFSFLAGPLMRVLVSVFAPIYWTTVLQRGAARNGYSFTHGQFRQESQLEFDTGESEL